MRTIEIKLAYSSLFWFSVLLSKSPISMFVCVSSFSKNQSKSLLFLMSELRSLLLKFRSLRDITIKSYKYVTKTTSNTLYWSTDNINFMISELKLQVEYLKGIEQTIQTTLLFLSSVIQLYFLYINHDLLILSYLNRRSTGNGAKLNLK